MAYDGYERGLEFIKQKDAKQLKKLVRRHPALVHETSDRGGLLIDACQSYANFAGEDPDFWTAVRCAGVLLDLGSELPDGAFARAMNTGSTTMVQLFVERGAVSLDLEVAAACGDLETVEDLLQQRNDPPRAAAACIMAARHGHDATTRALAEAVVATDTSSGLTASELAGLLLEKRSRLDPAADLTLGQSVRRLQLLDARAERDVARFTKLLAEEPALLTRDNEAWQVEMLEQCAFGASPEIAAALLDAGASVRNEPRPPSKATVYAIDYGCHEMIELLTPLWPPGDDLSTRAGLGDMAAVQAFFDADGELRSQPSLVYPALRESTDPAATLLHALGLALMNTQLEVASFLIRHGADLHGAWGLHEPASLLHEVAAHGRLESIQFLLDRGVDRNKRDERYNATAAEWASYAGQEEAVRLLSE